MQKARLTGLQIPPRVANFMALGTVTGGLTATGSTSQANSYAITDDISVFTTAAANTGARLPTFSTSVLIGPGDGFIVANYGANALLLYPPSGGKINNGSSNASISVPANSAVMCCSIDGLNYTTVGLLVPVGTTALANGHIFVGDGSNVAADVPVTGDISIINTGAVSVVRIAQILLTDPAGSALTTGDGVIPFRVNSRLNGFNLIAVAASVETVSSSGLPTIQWRRVRAGTPADMLTTKLTIDANEKDSSTAATPAVIDTSNDDVNTADHIYFDIDVAGTGAKGLLVESTFAAP